MVKFSLLIIAVVSCKELENLRLQSKQPSGKNVRLTVSYLGNDNCRRYLKKKGRSEKYIEAVIARNEKFGRYTTHLLGGENGDFAGVNNRGVAFSGDKFFTDEDRGIQVTSIRSTITQMSTDDHSKMTKQLLTMRTIEANCRRLLLNIYSPGHRPKVLTYPGTIIYPEQLQRFQEDFGNDFGKIDCGAGFIEPCSFTEIKGWYFLYVMPDVDNFVKLAISEHGVQEEHINVYGLVGYLLDDPEEEHYGKLYLRIAKRSLRQQITDQSATSLEIRINCQDKNWREAKVYHINDLNNTSLKIDASKLIEYFSARKFASLGKRHDCYRPGHNPRVPHDLWLHWQAIYLQFSFVVLGQPPQIYRYGFTTKKLWNAWFERRGTITATTDDGKQLSVLLTAP